MSRKSKHPAALDGGKPVQRPQDLVALDRRGPVPASGEDHVVALAGDVEEDVAVGVVQAERTSQVVQ